METRVGIRIMDPQEEDVPKWLFLFLVLSILAVSVVLYVLFIEFFEIAPAIFVKRILGLI